MNTLCQNHVRVQALHALHLLSLNKQCGQVERLTEKGPLVGSQLDNPF